ncbi:MAG: carotenoid 1,2-hydratase [Silicimonas sp.]|nr:carotenoid 1,2-hydratase [Silicimonas sp.]
MNVATYGPGGRFTMTDRGRAALRQDSDALTLGPSRMAWRGDRLEIDVTEWAAPPLPGRVTGRITLHPVAISDVEWRLTETGSHIWRPFAPVARIEVDLNRGLKWSGHGYFDANFGSRALEQDFSYWTWARYPTRDGVLALYDATRLDGSESALALRFGADGGIREEAPPPKRPMARSLWALRRETRGDADSRPHQVKPMLDAPFYCRALVETQLDGAPARGVHEALDLRRFRQPWLKPMIALRVPRRRGWRFDDQAAG